MVGLERSTLPLIGRESFHLTSSAAVLSFIVAFGFTKALTNLGAGALAQRAGRRRLLILGWVAALPVPALIATAPSWIWVVAANAVVAFVLSVMLVRDTTAHVALEQSRRPDSGLATPRLRAAFASASYRVPSLRSCSQAGLVNNLNDGLVWGLVPLFLAAHGASVGQVGLVAAVYPGVWAVAQIATGHWSDSVGRKPLIVAGMLLQAGALAILAH